MRDCESIFGNNLIPAFPLFKTQLWEFKQGNQTWFGWMMDTEK